MKKTAIGMIIILTSIIAGQDFYATLGGSQSWIHFHDDDMYDLLSIKPKTGFLAGVECTKYPYTVGIRYSQRGSGFKFSKLSEDEITEIDRFGYVDIYGSYNYAFATSFKINGGFQLGIPTNGDWIIKEKGVYGPVNGGEIDYADMNLDFGLLLGLDYQINDDLIVGLHYYQGFSQLYENLEPEYNALNRNIFAELKYKINTRNRGNRWSSVKFKEHNTAAIENYFCVNVGLNSSNLIYRESGSGDREYTGGGIGGTTGLEYQGKHYILGLEYYRHTAKFSDGIDNYHGYGMYMLIRLGLIPKRVAFLLGFSSGGNILGITELGGKEIDRFDEQSFDQDYGYRIGTEFFITNSLGLRTTYYLGMDNIYGGPIRDRAYNRLLNVSVFYRYRLGK